MADSNSRSTRSSALQQQPPKRTYEEPAFEKPATPSSGSNHTWTDRERIVLRLLNELLLWKPEERTSIFNAVCADQHRAAGFPAGRDHASLRAQWSDRTRPNRACWVKVNAGPQGRKEEREWQSLEREVRRVAKEQGVALKEREKKETLPRGREGGKRSNGREDRQFGVRKLDGKLQQQAVGRSRKGGKFVREKKGKKRSSDVEEQQQIDDDAMDIDRPNDEQDEPDDALLDENDNQATMNEAQHMLQHDPRGFILAAPLLPMIHTSQIEWASTDAFWTASPRDGLTPIPPTSAIYKKSGKVHRVYDITNHPRDYILCNPRFCNICSPTTTSNPSTTKNPTSSLPFVHAKDIQRTDGKWTFAPSRGEGFDRQNTEYTEAFPRNVVFGDGLVRIVAVCTYAKCRVCEEHTHVQRKKGVDTGEVVEG